MISRRLAASILAIGVLFPSAPVVGQAAPEVEITAEPHHHLVLENKNVRVFYVDVPPHSDTLMHWHRHDYIYVTLGATEVVNQVKDKAPFTIKLQDGETEFLTGNFAHIARNLSDQPFQNVTIEVLEDQMLRAAPSPWPEDRGLVVLQGGTREILFVKDAIRAAELELQPGGYIPQHHHNGPHLTVALSDYELRSEEKGKPPVIIAMKRGECKWFESDYSRSITNSGKQTAKLITLEWP